MVLFSTAFIPSIKIQRTRRSVYAYLAFGAASWEVWVATVWLRLYFARATNYVSGMGHCILGVGIIYLVEYHSVETHQWLVTFVCKLTVMFEQIHTARWVLEMATICVALCEGSVSVEVQITLDAAY